MNKYVKYSLVVVAVSIIGIVVYFVTKSGNTVFSAANEVTYTCPMPQDSVLVRNQEIVLNAE
jgi:hypothetical protein